MRVTATATQRLRAFRTRYRDSAGITNAVSRVMSANHSQVVVGASTAATGLLPGLFAIDCWAVHAVEAVTRVEGVT